MVDKRDLYFDIQFGGTEDYSNEMLEANKDLTTKVLVEEEIKLKDEDQLVPETDMNINGKDYHITV